jgi:ferredoxin
MQYTITLKTPGRDFTFQCPDDMKILDAAEEANGEDFLPYSCRAGECGTCTGRLESGSVDQAEQSFIGDEQIDQGFINLCVTYPTSDCVILTHQEEELY